MIRLSKRSSVVARLRRPADVEASTDVQTVKSLRPSSVQPAVLRRAAALRKMDHHQDGSSARKKGYAETEILVRDELRPEYEAVSASYLVTARFGPFGRTHCLVCESAPKDPFRRRICLIVRSPFPRRCLSSQAREHCWKLIGSQMPRRFTCRLLLRWFTTTARLLRWARHLAIGAEHAAVARQRLQLCTAPLAMIEKLACVGRHLFNRLMAARRTCDNRL
jgi:hypothetical protein